MKIGEDCTIYSPDTVFIDEQYPWMITIGSHVRITQGVKILTHDYAWSVLKRWKGNKKHAGEILGASGKIVIGDNVFIGMNAIITRNVTVGNNVIIGAGSVVTKDCLDNAVYAGCPAEKVMDIEVYYRKRKLAQSEEAKNLALEYFNRYGVIPEKEVFREYFMLFETTDTLKENPIFQEVIRLCNNESETCTYIQNNDPMFRNYDEFLNFCFDKNKVRNSKGNED